MNGVKEIRWHTAAPIRVLLKLPKIGRAVAPPGGRDRAGRLDRGIFYLPIRAPAGGTTTAFLFGEASATRVREGRMLEERIRGWVDRLLRVLKPNLAPRQWARRTEAMDGFRTCHWPGRYKELAAMLRGDLWIACRAPLDGWIEWISLDLDCRHGATLHDREEDYHAVRRVMGEGRVPLVFATPGGGLRMLYRIPRTRIEEVITGQKTGIVADALRGAGLHVAPGSLEIFPQRTQADRLPLGRRMPILDAETLEPLAHARIGEEFDAEMTEGALRELERWYDRPYNDLVAHLRAPEVPKIGPVQLVRAGALRTTNENAGRVRQPLLAPSLQAGRSPTFSPEAEQLLRLGLRRDSSRYEAEFGVMMLMAVAPERFAQYGLRRAFTPHGLALATARWLADHHNDRSDEWSRDLARLGSVDAVVALWTRDRYLAPNSSGETMVDRVLRARERIDPLARRVRQASREDFRRVLDIAERRFGPGAQRMRFEVWCLGFYRAVQEIMSFHRWVGREGDRFEDRFELVGDPAAPEAAVVEIASEWMAAWPYGQGRDTQSRRTRYREYRDLLQQEGLATPVGKHVHFGPDDLAGRATQYRIPHPDPTELRDVPIAPWILKRACYGYAIGNRGSGELPLEEAYHMLFVEEAGLSLRQRYGYHASTGLRERTAQLHRNLEEVLAAVERDGILAA